MNDTELEESLRQLVPAAPSPALEERIAAALARPLAMVPAAGLLPGRSERLRRSFWPSLLWALSGAAVGCLAMLTIYPAHSTQGVAKAEPPPASVFVPAESAREVVSTEDAGTLYDDDNQPSKLMRYSSIERHTWTNPATGALVEVEVPREDVVLVPASYQ
jgi:hypothetical protein